MLDTEADTENLRRLYRTHASQLNANSFQVSDFYEVKGQHPL